MTRKILITLPESLLADVDAQAGPRERSAWIEQAIRDRLARGAVTPGQLRALAADMEKEEAVQQVKITHVPELSQWQVTLPWAGHAADKPIAFGATAAEAWQEAELEVGGPIRLHRDGTEHEAEAALAAEMEQRREHAMITDAQIEQMRQDAGVAGDVEMMAVCWRALGMAPDWPASEVNLGDMTREQARGECARVLRRGRREERERDRDAAADMERRG